jgi:hypothetical protein
MFRTSSPAPWLPKFKNLTAVGYLRIFVFSATLTIITAVAFNYFVDPFQFFRKAQHPRFSLGMMRHQMPGVIRNYPFDAAAMGNSLTANLRAEMLSNSDPPLHFVNLSMSGSTLNEVTLVADLALRIKHLRTIFWVIGYQQAYGYRFPDFPHCMYSKIFEHVPYCYLLNIDILKESVALIYGLPDLSRANWTPNLDGWQSYGYLPMDLHDHACLMQQLIGSRENIKPYTQVADSKLDPIPLSESPGGYAFESLGFSRLVLPLVDAHPEVRFNFFFPPVFTTEYWRQAFSGTASMHAVMKQELLKRSNVALWDFQGYSEVTENPQFYRDLYHYSADAAAKITHWMTEGNAKFRITDLETNKHMLQGELNAASDRLSSYFDERCTH